MNDDLRKKFHEAGDAIEPTSSAAKQIERWGEPQMSAQTGDKGTMQTVETTKKKRVLFVAAASIVAVLGIGVVLQSTGVLKKETQVASEVTQTNEGATTIVAANDATESTLDTPSLTSAGTTSSERPDNFPDTEIITSCPVAVDNTIDTGFGEETETGDNSVSVQTNSPIYAEVGSKIYAPATGVASVFVSEEFTHVEIVLGNEKVIEMGSFSQLQGALSGANDGEKYQVESGDLLGELEQIQIEGIDDKPALYFELNDGSPGGHESAYDELSVVCQPTFRSVGKNDGAKPSEANESSLEWTKYTNDEGDLSFELPGPSQRHRGETAGFAMNGAGMDGRRTAYSVVSGAIQETEIDLQEVLTSEVALFDAELVDTSTIQLGQASCVVGKGEYDGEYQGGYEIRVIVCSTDERLHVGHLRGPKSELSADDFQYFLDSFKTK